MKPGSLVECIDDKNPTGGFWNGDAPVKGELYTVSSIVNKGRGVHVEELINTNPSGFKISRFVEVQPPMDLTELLEETKLKTELV